MGLTTLDPQRHRSEDFQLDSEVIKGLWAMEDGHFWHRARNQWIGWALEQVGKPPPLRVLEVGCGSGAVLRHLARKGYEVAGVDTARVLLEKATLRVPSADLYEGTVDLLPQRLKGQFDVVGIFDVLEHLDDPEGLLRDALPFTAPRAAVLVSVPARMSLWSTVDELVGHKRRYETGELRPLLSQIGCTDIEEVGIFRFVEAAIKLRRSGPRGAPLEPAEIRKILLDDVKIPFAPVNWLFSVCCALESRWLTRKGNPSGASIVAWGRLP